MNQQTQPSPREHHFYVAIAKFLFHHSQHGIVSVRDPIRLKDAGRYGLSPLILYGLTVAGLPIRWMTFTPVDQPRPFRDVLLEAWGNAEGLNGQPDILRVNRHLAAASPELAEEMAKIGVQVEVAGAKEKSLPASLRSAQDSSRWLPRKHDGKDRSLAGSVQDLCRNAQEDHDFFVSGGRILRGVHSREVVDRIQCWLALPARVPVPTVTGGLDWEPGPWLSSWETSLPPDQPRYFNHDGFDGSTWLLTGEMVPEDIDDDDFWTDSDWDNAAEIARNLVACWPNPPAEIAGCAGITLRQLQWFISGKTPLDRHARFDLEALLGIEYDKSMGVYAGVGPYALVAHKPQAIKEIYESISGGGDACSCEIVPRQGPADPSWRYILINTYGEPPSIVMAPRGAKITERLPKLLLNYEGIRAVAPEFYRDVVSTCARACREPAANIREMKDFVKRYIEHWVDCAWLPE
ncbi:conserved hypothetical protein [Desulfonatronospira thiodismutans ASO3-1]|uniref:Uncharacterized protein n=1 Tax=Desulfonatronospira thiodismutans ASO3-1 TaxID=555779 RepID=D6SM56_9BACT|nr:hypothetical protein [Desulfonatronospira thiodismutans]EFI35767.1 conserved hypothetical protein [Desulfonatronospira thiodismutans ASO3-1]